MQDHIRRNIESTIKAVRSGNSSSVSIEAAMAEPEYIRQLADAIRENGNITSFNMEWNERSASEYAPLLEALATCKGLRNLRLDGNWIGDKHADKVAAVIQANPKLTRLSLADTGLTAAGCATITAAVQGSDHMLDFNISDNAIGDAGAEHLARCMASLPALRKLSARDCDIHDDGMEHFATALQNGQDTLVECDLKNNPATAQSGEKLLTAVKASKRRNLCYTPMTGHNPLAQYCSVNYKQAQEGKRILEDCAMNEELPFGGLLSTELASIYRQLPALQTMTFEDIIGQFEDFLDRTLPPVPSPIPTDWPQLTAPDDNGLCLLDNPRAWAHFGEIIDGAKAAGTPITREQLADFNHNGEDFLTIGMAFASEAVLPALHRHGIHLQQDALIKPDGDASPLLKSMTMLETVPQLFTEANWHGAAGKELRNTYHAMPEAAQKQVSNLNSLALRLDQNRQPDTTRGR